MPAKKNAKKQRLILIDAHAIIHRAYHALPEFSSSDGTPTGALYGLSTMLMAIIKDFKPDHMIAAFDLPKPTYRHEAYSDYKSGRKKADEALVKQLKSARDVFQAFNIPIYECEGFEADDVIGTVVDKTSDKKDLEVIIASGDMDTLQLAEKDRVKVYTLRKGIKDTVLYDEKAVKDRFGFAPKNLTDYKGLRGDPSDNIIGIQGIGEKTATTLIQEFGSIENMYKKLTGNRKQEIALELKQKGITERIVNLLIENQEEAEFSKMLATIHRDVPIKLQFSDESWIENVSAKNLKDLFTKLEFRSLIGKVDEFLNGNGATTVSENSDPEQILDTLEQKQTAIALWILDSSVTNPTIQDILMFAKTDDFQKAREHILSEIKKQNLEEVYEKIEKPLIPILEEMSVTGIKIDEKVLKLLSKEYHTELSKHEKAIWEMSGEEFNVNSPKQMAEVLFNKMGLSYKGMRKSSSGSYSTKEEVLHKIAEFHPIANKILEHRELQKLLSTYIDNIPKMLAKDGRLHTTMLQAGSVTGRMATQDPGLQNIPIRSDYGKRIRNAFVVEKNNHLLACDYSQIELRIAAMLSGDEKLIEIFKEGRDVHTNVAAFVFGIPEDQVDKDMRRKAKVINFGILYGMGVSALQKNLKTDRKEAQKFYDDYFKTFTTLADYLENVKKETAQRGYTETMFGRRRYFEGINSSLPFIRAQAERMAINAPIQGTEADIVKLAMVKIDEYLKKENLKDKVKMLLQIHDEILFEVDSEIVEKVAPKIVEIMESVFEGKETRGVPVIVDASVGRSWGLLISL